MLFRDAGLFTARLTALDGSKFHAVAASRRLQNDRLRRLERVLFDPGRLAVFPPPVGSRKYPQSIVSSEKAPDRSTRSALAAELGRNG
jgi:hypothetical protein